MPLPVMSTWGSGFLPADRILLDAELGDQRARLAQELLDAGAIDRDVLEHPDHLALLALAEFAADGVGDVADHDQELGDLAVGADREVGSVVVPLGELEPAGQLVQHNLGRHGVLAGPRVRHGPVAPAGGSVYSPPRGAGARHRRRRACMVRACVLCSR